MSTIPHLKVIENENFVDFPLPKVSGGNGGNFWLLGHKVGETLLVYPKGSATAFMIEFVIHGISERSYYLLDVANQKHIFVRPDLFSQTFELWELISED